VAGVSSLSSVVCECCFVFVDLHCGEAMEVVRVLGISGWAGNVSGMGFGK
jgi:hypothetical protein